VNDIQTSYFSRMEEAGYFSINNEKGNIIIKNAEGLRHRFNCDVYTIRMFL